MKDLGQDLRFAVRRLAQTPLFTAVALLTLALGIGANTAVFTLVNGVVLQPLPYRSPAELVTVWMQKTDGNETDSFSYADYLDVRAQSDTLEDLGFWTWWSMDITDADEPTSVQSVRVSANMLSVIGIEPAEGRLFRPEEAAAGNDKVAIVSHDLWQGHYGSRPLIGTQIEIDGEPHTVVGRLAPGASIEQAQTELATIAARLSAEYPPSNAGWSMLATSMHDSVVSGSTRAALGASRARLARELLAESGTMSLAGGILGSAFAAWGMKLFLSWVPAAVPRLDEITFDFSVLLFSMGVTVGTAVLFGLLPAPDSCCAASTFCSARMSASILSVS